MANNAKDDKTQSMLFELAAAWTKLADEIEINQALRDAVSEIDLSKSSPSHEG
jgi:hypothetical protein